MAFPNLPQPIAAFLAAARDRDTAALLATFAGNAHLTDLGREYRARAIEDWNDRRFLGAKARVHPINIARRDGRIVVTVMFDDDHDGTGHERAGMAGPLQLDWHFTLAGDRIAALDIIQERGPSLPAPVAAYVQAANSFDLDALLATFADDALVNDQFQDYWGKPAIRAWASRDIIGDRVTMYVVSAVEHHGNLIVTANVDGDYDKRGLPEPLVLSFYFSLRGTEIVQLIILHNQQQGPM